MSRSYYLLLFFHYSFRVPVRRSFQRSTNHHLKPIAESIGCYKFCDCDFRKFTRFVFIYLFAVRLFARFFVRVRIDFDVVRVCALFASIYVYAVYIHISCVRYKNLSHQQLSSLFANANDIVSVHTWHRTTTAATTMRAY